MPGAVPRVVRDSPRAPRAWSIWLYCSSPLLKNGLDRAESHYGLCGLASSPRMSTSTKAVDGARVSLWRLFFSCALVVVDTIARQNSVNDCRKFKICIYNSQLWDFKSWFSGRGWGQQLFSFQSPAVHWMARSSSLNCLSCRNPYQTPHSLNCLPLFTANPFFALKSASSHPLSRESAPILCCTCTMFPGIIFNVHLQLSNIWGTTSFMQLQFWSLSELTSHKFCGEGSAQSSAELRALPLWDRLQASNICPCRFWTVEGLDYMA